MSFQTDNQTADPASARVAVFDTTLRDGEQAAGVCFSLADKVEIACALEALRVDVIEAGFPGSSAGEHAAVHAVAEQVRDSEVCALARAVEADIDAAVSALRGARNPRVHVFLGSSALNRTHQLRRDAAQIEDGARKSVAYARARVPNVEFSPMDATRTEPWVLARVVRAAIEAGASTINLPDTVGGARPEQVTAMIRDVQERVPELASVVLSFHGQDDLGLATANTLAAVSAGARQVELAVNGIGERAGNTALEEVVMALALHGHEMGVHTRVAPRGIYALSRLVEARSGLFIPANKAVVGGNAFRHASGIHQDGVLKHRATYEVLDPAAIGHPTGTEIVLGKLSGRRGFESRVCALGIELDADELVGAFARFQALADLGNAIGERELRALCAAPCSVGEAWPGPGI